MTKTNYAGIDLGSNSCKLLICDENGKKLCLKNVSTRLAEGMHKKNMITDEAIERGRECFSEYRHLLNKHKVKPENMRAITTAACRMAKNGKDFIKKMYEEFAINLEIIDGLEEAVLNLKGAIEHVRKKSKYVVIYDLGGASTEVTFATNEDNPKIIHSISIPWGARNSSEAFDLVEYSEDNANKLRDEIYKYMDEFLQKSNLKNFEDVCFVATSSTPLRLASLIYCFEKYDREKADGMFIKREQMDAAICDLFKSKREELAKNPYVGDKRSYIFIAACVLFKAIYDKLQPDGLVASLKSAKDGIVASLIERDKKCQN